MTTADPQFEGVYGSYTITEHDRREVQRYRFALLVSGLAMSAGLQVRHLATFAIQGICQQLCLKIKYMQ